MLAALVDSEMQPAGLQRLRLKLQKSGRELEFRAKVRTWPTLAEVDSLLEIGLFFGNYSPLFHLTDSINWGKFIELALARNSVFN
jgi:hypothetical protein